MFDVDCDHDPSVIVLEFLKQAELYRQQNVCWTFDRPYVYTRTNVAWQLVASWKNYTTGEFAYVILDPAKDVEAAGFTWMGSSGDAHRIESAEWQATNWCALRNWNLIGESFFVGIQMVLTAPYISFFGRSTSAD